MDIAALFPIHAPGVTLSLIAPPTETAAGLRTHLRLANLDEAGAISSIKEQEVLLVSAAHRANPARVQAWLAAWVASLPALLAEVDAEELFPSDLLFPELLEDPALQAMADFAAVMADPARWEAAWAARGAAEFREHLATHLGAGDARAAAIEALSQRPSIAMNIDEDEPAALPLGASRLGGQPDLTQDRAWPQIGGVSLSFLAQVDLVALRAAVGEEAAALLPADGWLLFFFGLGGWGPVSSAKARGGGRVMHLRAPREALVRRAAPTGIETLALRSVVFEVEPRPLPNIETPFYPLLVPPPKDQDPYTGAWETFGFLAAEMQPPLSADIERPRDRLLGYADPLQSDPYVQCALEAEPIDLERAWDRAILEKGAAWSLLLQTDSDREAGVFLGDMGVVQFFIRPADLAAGRLERTRVVWQSA